jgi:peroxiredoxin
MPPEQSGNLSADRDLTRGRRAIVVVVSTALLGAAIVLWWLTRAPASAPEITFKTIGHGPIAMTSLRGQPVLITFWATSCATCIKEMPHLFSLYADYRSRGLEIIAVAMPYDPPNRVDRMVREREIPYPVAVDVLGQAARAFGGVELTPTTFFISPEGGIVERRIGALDMDRTRDRIDTLLSG